MNAPDQSLARLIAAQPSLEVLVIACLLDESQRIGAQPLIRGVDAESFAALNAVCVPGSVLANGHGESDSIDEFDELYALLLDYAEPQDQMSCWLAAAIATAAQRDNHLWQDLGLPSRRELSAVISLRFPRLAAVNHSDMKWKKFFYRQLCERAGVPICKSPNCVDCCDHSVCFGPEE